MFDLALWPHVPQRLGSELGARGSVLPTTGAAAGRHGRQLCGDLRHLDASIAGCEVASAAVAGAQHHANGVFARANRVVPWVTRAMESLSGLAGEHKLAERIRKCRE